MLVIFGGLPGAGKTTIARELSRRLRAAYLRVDSLEHALARGGVVALDDLGPAGYMAAAAVAGDNLLNGLWAVVDSVNPFAVTRDIWRRAAIGAGKPFFQIEVFCSDPVVHRRRVEERLPDPPDFVLPSWDDVVRREYHPWPDADLRLDTAALTPEQAVDIAARAAERLAATNGTNGRQ